MKISPELNLYHVTSAENAEAILRTGFEGDWGDVGYGVYLYDDLASAETYAAHGGWDGGLEHAVIIEIRTGHADTESVIPQPAWPNPEDYVHVRFRNLKEGDIWVPDMHIMSRLERETEGHTLFSS